MGTVQLDYGPVPVNAVHAVTSDLASMLPVLYALAALATLTVAVKPFRRVAYAVYRFTRRHAPKWLAPVIAVCLIIPGQADEIAVIAIALVPILRHARNRATFRRYVRTAWHHH